VSLDPVRVGVPVEAQSQRIFAEASEQDADRRHGAIEEQAHDHRANDGMQDKTELQPEPVEGAENPWAEETAEEEGRTSQETPPPHRSPFDRRDKRKDKKYSCHDQPEGPVGRALNFIIAPKAFVDGR
jgi:hypothetical protein